MLSTSTVVPPQQETTSPGRIAAPPIMFSARQSRPVTRSRTPIADRAVMVASTAAAPAISVFIAAMDVAGFNDRPPESKVIPLPTSATCRPREQPGSAAGTPS